MKKLIERTHTPSTIKSPEEVLWTLSHLFRTSFSDQHRARECLLDESKRLLDVGQSVANEQLEMLRFLFSEHTDHTLDVTVSEACGYAVLGSFLLVLRRSLADQVQDPNVQIFVHHQTPVWANDRRGPNPSADGSLMMVKKDAGAQEDAQSVLSAILKEGNDRIVSLNCIVVFCNA